MKNNNGHSTSSTRTMTNHDSDRASSGTPGKEAPRFLWLWFIVFLVVLAVMVGLVLWHRSAAQASLNANTQKMAEPTVLVVHPQKGDPQVHLTLPGTVTALMESSVYAQVSGYIKAWHVDIGAHVKAGQLLAEIDTPVTDQQLKQAAESVKQAQANLGLARATADRYNKLLAVHAVSQEDVDTQNAGVKVQEANLSAAQAFESGIQQTEAFKQVKAPFDGVITARRIDVGDFVSATGQTASTSNTTGTGPPQTGTPNQALFQIAQTRILRVYVNVPESYSEQIVPGIKAQIVLASSPSKPVVGTLVRTSNAIDANSLTLLSELDVDNPNGDLLPGGYAQAHFDITTTHPPLVIPGNAMIFRQQGPQVGVVDDTGTVHLKSIKIGRDLGTKLEIVDGIEENDQLILNPSDSLSDGVKVHVDTSVPDKKP